MSVNVKPGDQCSALCETCKQQVKATYQLRDLPIGGGVAKGVLCIVCNECGTVCGFHSSSLEAVQRAIKQNPDLPSEFVQDVIKGKMEADAGLVEEYRLEAVLGPGDLPSSNKVLQQERYYQAVVKGVSVERPVFGKIAKRYRSKIKIR